MKPYERIKEGLVMQLLLVINFPLYVSAFTSQLTNFLNQTQNKVHSLNTKHLVALPLHFRIFSN